MNFSKNLKSIIMNKFASSLICPKKFRIILYNMCGARISSSSILRFHCYFNSSKISIGNNSFINTRL